MGGPATAVLAVVRAFRPTFRSDADRLAFAVHAYVLTQGFKLVAAGAAAEDEAADFATSREEVGPEGWNELEGGSYAFRYQDTEGRRAPLYLKALEAGGKLLVHWVGGGGAAAAAGAEAEAAGSPPAASPQVLELAVDEFAGEAAEAPPGCYKNVDKLVGLLRERLGDVEEDRAAAAAAAAAGQRGGAADAGGSGRGRGRGGGGDDETEPWEPQQAPPLGYYRPPLGVGANDVVPPGFRPPGSSGGGGGLMEPPGPWRGGGGGMLVGPGDPLFGPGRMGGGVGGPPGHGGLPPGARWDPIAPPGMRGFHPDDFQRPPGQGRVHPDMAQPGPGRGTDWDMQFG